MISSWNYEQRVVAFIDVLGYKAFTALPNAEAQRIVELISHHLGAPRFDPEVNPFITPFAEQFSAKAFSDCIYLTDKLSTQGCQNVVIQAAALAHNLAVHGLYVRGGITSGRHFQDVNILFGEGIVRAYEMERSRAVNPRILIEKAMVDLLPPAAMALVATDADGEMFVDFWRYWPWEHTRMDLDLLYMTAADQYTAKVADFREAKIHLERNIADAKKTRSSALSAKFKWLANYHNERARALLNVSDLGAVKVN